MVIEIPAERQQTRNRNGEGRRTRKREATDGPKGRGVDSDLN